MSVFLHVRRQVLTAYPIPSSAPHVHMNATIGHHAAWDPCSPCPAVAPGSPLPSGLATPFGTPSVISDQRLPPHKRGLPQWEGEAGSWKRSKLAVTNSSV